jgi:hypothetical protein
MLSAPERIPFFRIVRQELDFASNSLIQRLPIACREESSPSCSTGSQRSIAVPKLRPSARWQAGRGTGPSWRSAIRLPVASPSKLSESAVNTHGLSPMMSRPPSPPVSIVPWMRAPSADQDARARRQGPERMAAMREKSSRHRSRSTPLHCAQARKGSRCEWLYGNYYARGVGSRVLGGIGPAQEHKMHDRCRQYGDKGLRCVEGES